MSYTVLARRYRSSTFDEVVGQNHIAQTLKKAIASGRIAHAYLFCGTRGTGKTSTARILAKALNCQSGKDGPVTEPCGKCESCLGIARGDDIDVIEIDAASNRGIDDVRRIIENAVYSPVRSRFKIYLIDEVHAMTKDAFNALLKILEEPPGHVKFILATTEPEKVLTTILSRCQRYDFRNIPTREIAGHLANICKQEKIDADEDALFLVAKAGAGSMRDSLSLLDRLLSLGEKNLTAEMIESLLGLPKSQVLFDLAEAIGGGDVKAVLDRTDAMIQSGLSVDVFLASLIDHLRNLLILSACGPQSNLVEVPGMSLAELVKQAQRFDAVTLSQDIAILEELRRQARQSNAGRALLDATLVRLALSEQFCSVADLLAKVGAAPVGQKKKFEPLASSAPPVAPVPTPVDIDSVEDDALPAVGRVWDDGPKRSLSEIMAANRANAPVAPVSIEAKPQSGLSGTSDYSATHQAVLALIAEKGPALVGLLSQGRFDGVEDGRAVIRYSRAQETTLRLLDRNGKRELVADALSEVLNQRVGVRFELDAADETPAPTTVTAPSRMPAPEPRHAASRPPAAPEPPATPSIRLTPELRAELEQDPLIRSLMEIGGSIVKVE